MHMHHELCSVTHARSTGQSLDPGGITLCEFSSAVNYLRKAPCSCRKSFAGHAEHSCSFSPCLEHLECSVSMSGTDAMGVETKIGCGFCLEWVQEVAIP